MADLPPEQDAALKRLGAALAEAGLCVVPIAEWEELRRHRTTAARLIRSTDLAQLLEQIRALPEGLEKQFVELLDVLRCSHEHITKLEAKAAAEELTRETERLGLYEQEKKR